MSSSQKNPGAAIRAAWPPRAPDASQYRFTYVGFGTWARPLDDSKIAAQPQIHEGSDRRFMRDLPARSCWDALPCIETGIEIALGKRRNRRRAARRKNL